jgi:hypothetical protein
VTAGDTAFRGAADGVHAVACRKVGLEVLRLGRELPALLLLLLPGVCHATIPGWDSDRYRSDPSALSYSVTQGEQTVGGTSYYSYQYDVTFNGTDLFTPWGVDRSRTFADYFLAFYRDPAIATGGARSSFVLAGNTVPESWDWQTGWNRDDSLAALWRNDIPGTSRMMRPGDHGSFTLLVDSKIERPYQVALRVEGFDSDGVQRYKWLKTEAPEPASLVLLGAAAGAGALVRRRRRRP